MVKLNPKFRQIRQKNSPRYVLLTGGRGSSKSFGVATIIADRVCYPSHSVLYTRYTMTSAGVSIIPEIQEKIDLLGVSQAFKTAGNIITNKINGSNIIFRGIKTSAGNQTANLKSLQGITTWVLDEADELVDEDDFDTIDYSIRTTTQKNQIILIMNPTTTDHWIWTRWFENSHKTVIIDDCKVPISTHPDLLHLHFTYHENLKHLNPELVRIWKQMKINNLSKYAHKVIGGWLNTKEGAIYTNWEEGEFDDTLPFCYGLDYGFDDPLAVIKVAVEKKKKRIYLQEIGYQSGVEDVAAYLEAKQVDKKKRIAADTNEPRTTKHIRKKGFNIKKARKGVIVEDIRELHNYKLVVDPKSFNLKKELRNYVWNDKKSEIPIDDYNHLLDAMRYAAFVMITRRRRGIKIKNRR